MLSYICMLIHLSLFLIGGSLPCEGYFKKHKAKIFYRGGLGEAWINSARSGNFCASEFWPCSEQLLAEQSSMPVSIGITLHIPSESRHLRGLHPNSCVLNVR